MKEICFLVSTQDRVLWSDRGTLNAIPDSHERWEQIWIHRSELVEIAHTHPSGLLAFSKEDRTTMSAIWEALDQDVTFSVVTATGMIRMSRSQATVSVIDEPAWVRDIRLASGWQVKLSGPSIESKER